FVICGCETHVCVMQTVLDLLAHGSQVFVVEEAVSSRRASDKELALQRMRQAGAQIVSREMVAFEWMERAGTELFKSISREFIRCAWRLRRLRLGLLGGFVKVGPLRHVPPHREPHGVSND